MDAKFVSSATLLNLILFVSHLISFLFLLDLLQRTKERLLINKMYYYYYLKIYILNFYLHANILSMYPITQQTQQWWAHLSGGAQISSKMERSRWMDFFCDQEGKRHYGTCRKHTYIL